MSHDIRVVLGTMTFGDGIDAADAERIVGESLERGVRDIDTANGYAGGESERILGAVLRGRRDDVRLASKVGIPHPDAREFAPLSAQAMERSLAGSLARLGTDHLDLYYLHQPDRDTPIGETLDALARFIDDGRISAWGVSNVASWQLTELVYEARVRGLAAPVSAQQLYNALCRRIEDEFVEASEHFATPIMAYNPLAGGLLTGNHHYAARPSEGRFGGERLGAMYTDRYWDPRMFEAVDRLRTLAVEAGISLREMALRWLIGRRNIDAVLLGGSKPEHISGNLTALAQGRLNHEMIAKIDGVGDWLAGPVPAFNR